MSLTSRRTVMARKRYKPEEIVAKLRQVDVLVSQGQNMVDAIRQIGVSEVTYYRWRQEFGGQGDETPLVANVYPRQPVPQSGPMVFRIPISQDVLRSLKEDLFASA